MDSFLEIQNNYNLHHGISVWLKTLINHQLFKILPMKEDNNKYLLDYIKSVLVETIGALYFFSELQNSNEYLRIINTLEYLLYNDYDVKQCKQEVFKMINLCKKVYLNVVGEPYE